MLYSLGRLLQSAALFVILPLAVVGQAIDRIEVKEMLYLLVLGVVVFYVGWWLQERFRPPK
jgi:hypothetical protein